MRRKRKLATRKRGKLRSWHPQKRARQAGWTRVESSALAALSYSARSRMLLVKFNSGSVYRYRSVPPAVAKQLLSAESYGRSFALLIRNQYRTERLAPVGVRGGRSLKTYSPVS